MEVQSIALAGLEKAQERLAAVAKRLSSNGLSAAYGEGGGDQVDLSAEMVALLEAKVATEANLKLVESANEMASKTINILG
jgi:flagellar basal body rod protein FlgG